MSARDKTSQKGVDAQGWRQTIQSRGGGRGRGAVNKGRSREAVNGARAKNDAQVQENKPPVALKQNPPPVKLGPGAKYDAKVLKGRRFIDALNNRPRPQTAAKQPPAEPTESPQTAAKQPPAEPTESPQTAAKQPPAKPTQSWYSVCAKKLWNGEGDALAVFLAELLKECKSTDNDIAIVTNDSIKKIFSKKSEYNAGGLPQLVEEVLDQQNTDFHWGAIIIHIWNVLNDPSQQFVMEEDDIVMQALCIIFESKIIFEENGKPLRVWSVDQILRGEEVKVWISFCYHGEIPYVYNQIIYKPRKPPPTPLFIPAARQRVSKGAPSAASKAFLEAMRTEANEKGKTLENQFTSALSEAYKKIDSDPNRANEDVYEAFKAAFGVMLSKTQKNCFMGWMKELASQEITKTQWLAVLKESNALWHAVVVEFRRMYEALKVSDEFQKIEVSELAQKADGTSIPTHHISDLRIWCHWSRTDVARGRWRTYVRKEFAKNTEHFVREYQTLLMERYNKVKVSMFGFWFYPSDLCQWVRDLQTMATMGHDAFLAQTRSSGYKPFRWPQSCRKGESMADGSADSIVYKTFCRMNRLPFDDPRSRLQFCMRMRAAWLRVVDSYPYTKDGPAPTEEQIKEHLEKQHIYEISVFKTKNGAMDWRIVENREVLLRPQEYSFDRLRDENLLNHRVIVYGAPMRCAGAAANPYLCASSLQ